MRLVTRTILGIVLSLTGIEANSGVLIFPPGAPRMNSVDWSKLHPLPDHYWTLDLIMEDGSTNKWMFSTAEACQASISKYEKEKHGYNGECIEHQENPTNPLEINPAAPGPATRRDSVDSVQAHPLLSHYWALDLTMEDGGINRYLFDTNEECQASIPKYEKERHGHNGKCTVVAVQPRPLNPGDIVPTTAGSAR